MNEALFGSGSPIWAAPASGFALQTPIVFGSNPIATPAFGSSTLGNLGAVTPGVREISGGALPALGYVASGPAMLPATTGLNLAPGFSPPFGVPAAFGPETITGVTPLTLLSAVAMRRGQPQGPTNDQEVEDFIYDALELLSGASDIDVRCENGRATLSGSVHHKRVKRDAGEIAWAIPGLQDVQNNVTITSRRRARAAGRETETASSTSTRK